MNTRRMNTRRNQTDMIYYPSTSYCGKMKGRSIAACFFSCRIPQAVDDSKEPKCYTSSVANTNTRSLDTTGEDSRWKGKGRKPNKRNYHQEMTSDSSHQVTHMNGNYRDESRRSSVKEEDEYIVFYLNNNESLDMITENRESQFGEEDGIQSSYRLKDNMGDMKIEESVHAQAGGEEISDVEEMEDTGTSHGGKMLSLLLSARESTDSIRSDASTSSFTFPVLRWEGTGSPVHMPGPNDGLSAHQGFGIACFHGHMMN